MKDTDTQVVTKTDKTFTKFFTAECDYFGYIDGSYRRIDVTDPENNITTMQPFEYNYTEAISSLHAWIIENDGINAFPKAKWNIYLVDGSFGKFGQLGDDKVYSISSAKAKKLLI